MDFQGSAKINQLHKHPIHTSLCLKQKNLLLDLSNKSANIYSQPVVYFKISLGL